MSTIAIPPQHSQNVHPNDKHQKALSAIVNFWASEQPKESRGNASVPEGYASALEDYAGALERFVNMQIQRPNTSGIYNLAAHTWLQIRGTHNAAEGYKPGGGRTASERNKQVAAVLSKLWLEADPNFNHPERSLLKPFPAPLASVALQVGKLW